MINVTVTPTILATPHVERFSYTREMEAAVYVLNLIDSITDDQTITITRGAE